MPDPADVGRAVGIVLAGGAATRFGSDKLLATVDGLTLVDRAAQTLAGLCGQVVLVLSPDGEVPPASTPVIVARDVRAHLGPLSGIATGLAAAGEGTALVVGGDMPWLHPGVGGLLLAGLSDPAVAVVALADADRSRPLPIAVRSGAALAAAERLLAAGERRLRALLEELPTSSIDEATWRALDPDGWSFRDVDEPGDLPDRGPTLG